MGWIYLAIFVIAFVLSIVVKCKRGAVGKGRWILDGIYMLMLALALLHLTSATDSLGDGDAYVFARLVLALFHLAAVAAGITLSLVGWKHAWIFACGLGLTYVLLTFWPAVYNGFLFPGSNAAEDLFTAIYLPDFLYFLTIIITAAVLTALLWLGAHFLKKKPAVLLAAIVGLVVLMYGGLTVARALIIRPDFAPAYDVASYEYLAPVLTEGQGWGFINERGELVILCQYEEIVQTKACQDAFLYVVSEDGDQYLLNESGECVHNGARSYTFFDGGDLIAVEKSFQNYKLIDPSGELVSGDTYHSIEDIEADYGLTEQVDNGYQTFHSDQKQELQILYDEDLESDYLTDKAGNILIPPDGWQLSFCSDPNYIKADTGWGLINAGRYDDECSIFDREGNVVIPAENRVLMVDNENGWFFAMDPDGRFYYIDENNREMLDLGYQYSAREGFCKIKAE